MSSDTVGPSNADLDDVDVVENTGTFDELKHEPKPEPAIEPEPEQVEIAKEKV
jgi:hypothetical protein